MLTTPHTRSASGWSGALWGRALQLQQFLEGVGNGTNQTYLQNSTPRSSRNMKKSLQNKAIPTN